MFKFSLQKKKSWVVIFISLFASHMANASQTVTLYELAQEIAEKNGLTFIFSPRVKKTKKVSIYLGDQGSDNSLFEMFTTLLNVHGYTVIEQDDIVLIIRKRRAKQLWSE